MPDVPSSVKTVLKPIFVTFTTISSINPSILMIQLPLLLCICRVSCHVFDFFRLFADRHGAKPNTPHTYTHLQPQFHAFYRVYLDIPHAISSWLISLRVPRCDLRHHGVTRLDLPVYPSFANDPCVATRSIPHSSTSSGMASISADVPWTDARCNGCLSTHVASSRCTSTSTPTLDIILPVTTFMDNLSVNSVISTHTTCSTSWTSRLQCSYTSAMRNPYTEITAIHDLTTWRLPGSSRLHVPSY